MLPDRDIGELSSVWAWQRVKSLEKYVTSDPGAELAACCHLETGFVFLRLQSPDLSRYYLITLQ